MRRVQLRMAMPGVLAVILVASSWPAGAQPSTATTVVLVRHAERSAGQGDDPLSEAGQARAQTLARMLRDADVRRIITSDRLRTQQTAEPLAKAKNLRADVVSADKLDAVVEIARQVKDGLVVIVHHSNTVPALVAKLGGSIRPIADDEFDRLVLVTLGGAGPPGVLTLRYGAPAPK